MASESDSRKLTDLRVIDLRSELERRGLDKTGNKQILVERLQKALTDEGLDPDTYNFDTSEKKPVKRLSTSSRDHTEGDLKTEGGGDEHDSEMQDNTEAMKKEEKQKGEGQGKIKENGEDKDESKEENEEIDYEAEKDKDETESVIHLNLEEEENFHYDDTETDDAKTGEGDTDKGDEKNSSNENTQRGSENVSDSGQGEGKNKEKAEGDDSSKKSGKTPAKSRNLWITNISQNTRATELKQALSEYGKVIGAKVVINAKYPGACCYGYVTMETAEDADNCIAKLNNTELNGQIIKIEKVRTDHMNMKTKKDKGDDKSKEDHDKDKKDEDGKKERDDKDDKEKDKDKEGKEYDDKHSTEKKDSKGDGHKTESVTGKSGDSRRRKSRSYDRSRDHRRSREDRHKKTRSRSRGDRSISSKSRRHDRERDMLTFDKIKEERERQRLRERERILREESRRRREEAVRQREIERHQRSEAARLEREREKLRIEREKLEREKAEIIRLERERQKLEREKLELEKLELQRAKLRLQEEDRRPVKRTAPYHREDSYEERKRLAGERRYEEAPPTPRYEPPPSIKAPSPPRKIVSSKDYKSRGSYEKHDSYPKRDHEYDTTTDRSHTSSLSRGLPPPPPTSVTKYEGSSVFNISRERDVREARPREGNANPTPSSRYDRERANSPHYRVRDERDRRPVPDHKPDVRSRDHRYEPTPKGNVAFQSKATAARKGYSLSSETGRFDGGRGSNNWPHPNAPSGKPFAASSAAPPAKSWPKDSWRSSESSGQERWNSGSAQRSSGSLPSAVFVNNSNMNMAPSCPPPPGINNYSSDRFDYKSMGNIRKY